MTLSRIPIKRSLGDQIHFICPYDLVANSVGLYLVKYRIPVTIQLNNVFWARSSKLGNLYIGEVRWGRGVLGRGGGL